MTQHSKHHTSLTPSQKITEKKLFHQISTLKLKGIEFASRPRLSRTCARVAARRDAGRPRGARFGLARPSPRTSRPRLLSSLADGALEDLPGVVLLQGRARQVLPFDAPADYTLAVGHLRDACPGRVPLAAQGAAVKALVVVPSLRLRALVDVPDMAPQVGQLVGAVIAVCAVVRPLPRVHYDVALVQLVASGADEGLRAVRARENHGRSRRGAALCPGALLVRGSSSTLQQTRRL